MYYQQKKLPEIFRIKTNVPLEILKSSFRNHKMILKHSIFLKFYTINDTKKILKISKTFYTRNLNVVYLF